MARPMKIELYWKGPDGLPKQGIRLVSCSLTDRKALVGHIINDENGKSLRYYWDRRKNPNSRPVVWIKHEDDERKTRNKYAVELTKAFVLRAIELGILDIRPGEDEFGQQALGVPYRYAATVIIGRNRSERRTDFCETVLANSEEEAKTIGRLLLVEKYGEVAIKRKEILIRNVSVTKA